MEAVRIIKEMRRATHGSYPVVVIWENVPGAFSSNGGEDFRAVLEELARVEQPDASIPRPPRGADGAKPEKLPEMDGPWLGDSSTLNIGECPREESVSLLSWILQGEVPEKYYLSAKACRSILTRASRRGKKLQELLETALLEMIEWWASRGAERSLHLENTFGMRRRRQGSAGADRENRDAIDAPRPDAFPIDSRTDVLH